MRLGLLTEAEKQCVDSDIEDAEEAASDHVRRDDDDLRRHSVSYSVHKPTRLRHREVQRIVFLKLKRNVHYEIRQ